MKIISFLPFISAIFADSEVPIDPTTTHITLPWGLCLKGRFHMRAITTRNCKMRRKYHWERTASGSLHLINSNNLCVQVHNTAIDHSKLVMRTCADIPEQKFVVLDDGKWTLADHATAGDNRCVYYDAGTNRNIRYGIDPNYVVDPTPATCDACGIGAVGTCTREPNSGTGMYCKCDQSSSGYYNNCYQSTATSSPSCGGCENGQCRNSATFPNSWYCMCEDGYTGPHCENHISLNDCSSDTCRNGGSCMTNPNGGYYCNCASGWTGAYCENVDNGSDPVSDCWACVLSWNNDGSPGKIGNGICTENNGEGQYCHCSNSLYGRWCQESAASTDPNWCNNCSQHSTCGPDPQFGEYWCTCEDGYTGIHCDERIFLLSCKNGETCGTNGACTFQMLDNVPGYYCSCSNGASGAYCEN